MYTQKEMFAKFAAISIFGLFAINPTLGTITQLHKQIEDMELLKEALTIKSANLSKLESKYSTLQSDIPLLKNVVPEIPHAPYLLGQLQAIAQKNGVTVTNMQSLQVDLQKQRRENLESSYVFSVDAEGEYENLLQFTTDLTTFNRLVTFDKISMLKTVTQTSGETVRLSIRARAFFRP